MPLPAPSLIIPALQIGLKKKHASKNLQYQISIVSHIMNTTSFSNIDMYVGANNLIVSHLWEAMMRFWCFCKKQGSMGSANLLRKALLYLIQECRQVFYKEFDIMKFKWIQ